MARTSRKNLDVAPAQVSKIVFRAGAYVRQSVDKKDRGETIETQQAIISAFVTEYPDIELADVYIDNGHSGQSFERPSFQRMLADIESGRINCCVTKDLSRLGRNAIDSGFYVEKFFPTKGVRFIAITDNYDSVKGNGGGIMVSLKNMINEAYECVQVGTTRFPKYFFRKHFAHMVKGRKAYAPAPTSPNAPHQTISISFSP
jgi:hypothetical protein